MKAIRMHAPGRPEQFVYEDVPQPQPGNGEVLVRVYAAGVTPAEPTWAVSWKTSAGIARPQPIPGHDVAGVVAEVGHGVGGVTIGEEVYGLTDFERDGAEAEYTIALPGELAPKPQSLDFNQAAPVPLTALTVWQAFFDHAHLAPGQTVLIHGAAGGVGSFAVQVARWAGAQVIGTASEKQHDMLRKLGAAELIDYTAIRFEDVVHNVDVVLDTVGGETLERSWDVLKKGGILVSLVENPSQERAAALGVRALFFIVQPNRAQLIRIGQLIDAGQVRPVVESVLPLAQARQAYAASHHSGKTVLQIFDETPLQTPSPKKNARPANPIENWAGPASIARLRRIKKPSPAAKSPANCARCGMANLAPKPTNGSKRNSKTSRHERNHRTQRRTARLGGPPLCPLPT